MRTETGFNDIDKLDLTRAVSEASRISEDQKERVRAEVLKRLEKLEITFGWEPATLDLSNLGLLKSKQLELDNCLFGTVINALQHGKGGKNNSVAGKYKAVSKALTTAAQQASAFESAKESLQQYRKKVQVDVETDQVEASSETLAKDLGKWVAAFTKAQTAADKSRLRVLTELIPEFQAWLQAQQWFRDRSTAVTPEKKLSVEANQQLLAADVALDAKLQELPTLESFQQATFLQTLSVLQRMPDCENALNNLGVYRSVLFELTHALSAIEEQLRVMPMFGASQLVVTKKIRRNKRQQRKRKPQADFRHKRDLTHQSWDRISEEMLSLDRCVHWLEEFKSVGARSLRDLAASMHDLTKVETTKLSPLAAEIPEETLKADVTSMQVSQYVKLNPLTFPTLPLGSKPPSKAEKKSSPHAPVVRKPFVPKVVQKETFEPSPDPGISLEEAERIWRAAAAERRQEQDYKDFMVAVNDLNDLEVLDSGIEHIRAELEGAFQLALEVENYRVLLPSVVVSYWEVLDAIEAAPVTVNDDKVQPIKPQTVNVFDAGPLLLKPDEVLEAFDNWRLGKSGGLSEIRSVKNIRGTRLDVPEISVFNAAMLDSLLWSLPSGVQLRELSQNLEKYKKAHARYLQCRKTVEDTKLNIERTDVGVDTITKELKKVYKDRNVEGVPMDVEANKQLDVRQRYKVAGSYLTQAQEAKVAAEEIKDSVLAINVQQLQSDLKHELWAFFAQRLDSMEAHEG